MKRKSTILLRFGLLLLFIFSSTQFSHAQERTNLEKLILPFPVNFTQKEIKSLNSLSPADLEKLNKVIELIRGYGARSQNTIDTCTTEVCKNQKLLEKCRKENAISAFPKSEECKKIDPSPLLPQTQLQKDLLDEKAMLADKNHDAHVSEALRQIQTNPPPSVPQSGNKSR